MRLRFSRVATVSMFGTPRLPENGPGIHAGVSRTSPGLTVKMLNSPAWILIVAPGSTQPKAHNFAPAVPKKLNLPSSSTWNFGEVVVISAPPTVYEVLMATVSPARKEFASGNSTLGVTGYVTSTEPRSCVFRSTQRPISPRVAARMPAPNSAVPKR
jgi:hypothetical protein